MPPAPVASPVESAFTVPDAALREALDAVERSLRAVWPLKTAHRRELPPNIKLLSELLTAERSQRDAKYLQSPQAQAAYLHYFLPWNLLRLGMLLPRLDLDIPDGGTVIDLGSGPMTVLLALWMARPELRTRRITAYCVDTAKKTMHLGLDLLKHMAGGDLPWHVHCVNEPLEKGLASIRHKADLLVAANVFNEMRWGRDDILEEQVAAFTRTLLAACKPPLHGASVRALFVEPGNRLGGKLMGLARAGAVGSGWLPAGPCTHAADCPQLARNASFWCHFRLPALGTPQWLADLTAKAGLPKQAVSLGYLALARRPDAATAEGAATASGGVPPWPAVEPGQGVARIISEGFTVPGHGGLARYGCSERGLVLVLSRPRANEFDQLPPGCLVRFSWPEEITRDAKSGAIEVRLP
ncbi:MAG: small ribosomal subunit Rsm22 family protein [Desulfovibrionaceae bacterium]